MKTMRLLFFLFFYLISFCIFAQRPLIICEKGTYNFGEIKETDGPVTHTFIIKNVGKAPLVINDCTVSCGCTTPVWTKAPIAPGKTGMVKVTFNPKDRPGTFAKPISVYSNATKFPLGLSIRGNVIPAEKK